MITRIVKMEFDPSKVEEFLIKFDDVKHKIRNFDGCQHLTLLRDINHDNILFTYSSWDSTESLDHYRNSELFIDTWAYTKQLFQTRAQAWSVDQVITL